MRNVSCLGVDVSIYHTNKNMVIVSINVKNRIGNVIIRRKYPSIKH